MWTCEILCNRTCRHRHLGCPSAQSRKVTSASLFKHPDRVQQKNFGKENVAKVPPSHSCLSWKRIVIINTWSWTQKKNTVAKTFCKKLKTLESKLNKKKNDLGSKKEVLRRTNTLS